MINSSDFSRSNAQIIKYPIITDKATRLLENNKDEMREREREGRNL